MLFHMLFQPLLRVILWLYAFYQALSSGFGALNAAKIQIIGNRSPILWYTPKIPGVSMEPKLDLEGPQMPEETLVMSGESMDSFFSFLESQGKTKLTIETYRRCLERLFAFLPDSKEIGRGSLRQWRETMLTEGVAVGTVNLQIAAANSYLEFEGRREFQLKPMPHEKPLETPALTWAEYLCLLQTARTLENQKSYLLIKLFCNTGIRIRELPDVTLEAVNEGEMTIAYKKSPKRVAFPSVLRTELLDYASGAGIRSGPLFVRKNGAPLTHSEILPLIVKLFKKAGLPREKATTKTLRQFYRTTREKIQAEIVAQVEGTYESLLSGGTPFVT